MFRVLTVLLLISGLAAMSACVSVKPIYYDDDKAVARSKVVQLHVLYNNDDFAAIYELLTDRLKHETTKEAFVASLAKLKVDNGRFVESKDVDSQVVPQASRREVLLKYSSKYEKSWCDEGFALFVDGKDAVVDLLMINPSAGPAQPKR